MELRACPLCQHKTAEIIQRGQIKKYEDGHYEDFDCEKYYISCKACGYMICKESKIDAVLAWNMDTPTAQDLQFYIDHGISLMQKWEQEQMWLPKNN